MIDFNKIWLLDFEFQQPEGEVPRPICMVARNFGSSETLRIPLWEAWPRNCPSPLGPDVLYVAFMASAEMHCHLWLRWSLPVHVLDLSAEFRLITAGKNDLPSGRSLLGALAYFGINSISASSKNDFRALAIRGGPFTGEEMEGLLDYCETDVDALEHLLREMLPVIKFPHALIRGRYMKAVAHTERNGVPVAVEDLQLLREGWPSIQLDMIEHLDADYGVYDGTHFRQRRFQAYCTRNNIPWPTLESGQLSFSDETFKEMATIYPQLSDLRELRRILGQTRLNALAVGTDGRNRYLTGAFGSKTGRNQPSSNKCIFGASRWIRHLIRPEPGMALAYIDYCQQEFGIAAALSGDSAMKAAYLSGDPYLDFAKRAGAVPSDATKATHSGVRDRYKVAALGILMGMGAESLGNHTGTCKAAGSRLLRQHREIFPKFWEWSDSQVDSANLGRVLTTTYGWELQPRDQKANTLRNFALQANGADMLRLAAIAITERGIKLCAMVHDAVWIEAPAAEIDAVVVETQRQMAAASRSVLGDFEIETDAEIIRHPDSFSDERGRKVWKTLAELAGLKA